MAAVVVTEVEVDAAPPPPRWLQVVAGIAWILISLVVLSFDANSMATIGYLTGFVLILAGVDEFVVATVVEGWKWLHGILAALFILGGIASFMAPFQTFGYLALFVGWYLVIKGIFDLTVSIAMRGVLPLWGLLLALGIGEVLLGLWAIGYPGRSTYLVLLWVGFGAMFRGIGDLVGGFTREGTV
jgi:uncharacterized membrane protein HdeD (DUF308 family)